MSPAGRRRAGARAAGALVAPLVAMACALAPSPRAGAGLAPSPAVSVAPRVSGVAHGVAIVSESITFVDHSRPTPARGASPAAPDRVLVTEIRRPRRIVGRAALVVFLHGYDSDPGVYETLLDTWAAAGYFVAAPVIPNATDLLAGPPVSDYPSEARDASFLVTSLLRRFSAVLDPSRIAVAGHSDGATDVTLLALNPAYADHRIRAYLSLSGEIPPNVPGPWNARTPGALLVSVGSADQYGLAVWSRQVFAAAQMPKAMVIVLGGDHLGTYIGDSPGALELRAETLTFLRVALRGRPSTAALGVALTTGATPSVHVLP